MGLYVKIETEILTDPKIMALSPEAFTLFVKGLAHAKQHETDGELHRISLKVVGIGIRNVQKAAQELLKSGLWMETENGFTVGAEKWAKYQTTKQEIDSKRAQNRDRQQRFRDRKQGQDNAGSNDARNALLTQPEYRVQSTELSITDTEGDKPVGGRPPMRPPTQIEVCNEFVVRGKPNPNENAVRFWNHYQSINWKKSGTRIEDWRPLVELWNCGPAPGSTVPPKAEGNPATSEDTEPKLGRDYLIDPVTGDRIPVTAGAK